MPNSQMASDEVVTWVHLHLRKWCHDANNALFIAKGYLEEVLDERAAAEVQPAATGDLNSAEALSAVIRAMARLEDQVLKLRHFAKDEIFDHTGLPKPKF
jgi:hypothetical protein